MKMILHDKTSQFRIVSISQKLKETFVPPATFPSARCGQHLGLVSELQLPNGLKCLQDTGHGEHLFINR